jgi:hypothetical protein
MGYGVMTQATKQEDSGDPMLSILEYRFIAVERPPNPNERRNHNGVCGLAGSILSLALELELQPRATPLESPRVKRLPEVFMSTNKRDGALTGSYPDAGSVMAVLPGWFAYEYRLLSPELSATVHVESSSRATDR